MRRFSLVLIATFLCVCCRTHYRDYYGFWYLKNNTAQTNIYVMPLQTETPVLVAVGDSVCIGQLKGLNAVHCDLLCAKLREQQGEGELGYSISDSSGRELKRWRMRSLGIDSHHLFDESSWIEYIYYEELVAYKHIWVYAITDEDLQSND